MREQLEVPEGHVVQYVHRRLWRTGRTTFDDHGVLSPQGGNTVAKILNNRGKVVAIGVSVCSLEDGYSRKIGRPIALSRALRVLYHGDDAVAGFGPRTRGAYEREVIRQAQLEAEREAERSARGA